MISGTTKLIAHLGYPTHSFKAPLIYNPYFEKNQIDAIVVPMGCKPEDYPEFLKLVFKLSNIHGALITMPHKITTMSLLAQISKSAQVAGACNAVRLGPDGSLEETCSTGKGSCEAFCAAGGGSKAVGRSWRAPAASAPQSRPPWRRPALRSLALYDAQAPMMNDLAERLHRHYPSLRVVTGHRDPDGYEIVVNATPLGMNESDPLPMDVSRISPSAFVGEVVMKQEITPFLAAVRARGCEFQVGIDMLFEQIPAYLEFFGFPTTTAEELRAIAEV